MDNAVEITCGGGTHQSVGGRSPPRGGTRPLNALEIAGHVYPCMRTAAFAYWLGTSRKHLVLPPREQPSEEPSLDFLMLGGVLSRNNGPLYSLQLTKSPSTSHRH